MASNSLSFLRLILGAAVLCAATWNPAAGQSQVASRLVIATDVACREQPSVVAAAVGSLRLGDQLSIAGEREEDGARWYFVSDKIPTARPLDPALLRGHCWVYGPLTAEFSTPDSGPALVAAADRVLEREDARFEELVAVENLFAWEPFATAVASSGLLQVRRLSLIDRAASRLGLAQREPLPQAWLLSRQELLGRSEFSAAWYVRPEVYWDLYARHEGAPEADDIAWAAVHAQIPTDECYTACILNLLAETHMQYWTRFPHGRYIAESMAAGTSRAEYAAGFCILSAAPEYGLFAEDPAIAALVARLRSSLERVTLAEKETLLTHLSVIEDTCVPGGVDGLEDPRAISGLVRALGLGFRVVTQSLAAFGEAAVPAVLAVVSSNRLDSAVADGLTVLRFIVESSDSRPLSAEALAGIRRVARQWLSEEGQSTGTLSAALNLAMVLDDPDLRRIVASLASNPDEIMALGVTFPASISFIQRQAADLLAGAAPLPRP